MFNFLTYAAWSLLGFYLGILCTIVWYEYCNRPTPEEMQQFLDNDAGGF